MEKHLKAERTLVMVKPDGVQRNLIGEIIKRHDKPAHKSMTAQAAYMDFLYAQAHGGQINL